MFLRKECDQTVLVVEDRSYISYWDWDWDVDAGDDADVDVDFHYMNCNNF